MILKLIPITLIRSDPEIKKEIEEAPMFD